MDVVILLKALGASLAFVLAVLSDLLEHNPLNPYAYYQKNSSARDSITMKQNELESSSMKEDEL